MYHTEACSAVVLNIKQCLQGGVSRVVSFWSSTCEDVRETASESAFVTCSWQFNPCLKVSLSPMFSRCQRGGTDSPCSELLLQSVMQARTPSGAGW